MCRTLADSPLVGIFQAGYAELTAQLKAAGQHAGAVEGRPAAAASRPTLKSLDALDRALLRAAGAEMPRLEKRLTFLATTASISPFIGLFGTVWGIMTSFQQIGAHGLDEPGRGRARHRRGADRHGGRACSPPSRPSISTTTSPTR